MASPALGTSYDIEENEARPENIYNAEGLTPRFIVIMSEHFLYTFSNPPTQLSLYINVPAVITFSAYENTALIRSTTASVKGLLSP